MKLFGPIYERALVWARNPRAPALLTGLSFAEAVFFPVPPEVMLAPMALSQRQRAFRFASLSLMGSLAGAVLGYALGRGLTLQDSCTVDSIIDEVEKSNYSAHALIDAVVMSVPFRYQAAQNPPAKSKEISQSAALQEKSR